MAKIYYIEIIAKNVEFYNFGDYIRGGMRSIIEKQTDPKNKKSQRVLEKCGFAPLGIIGEEGPRFYREN